MSVRRLNVGSQMMRTPNDQLRHRLLCASRLLGGLVTACVMLAPAVRAQEQSPGTKIEALGLESMTVGRVTTRFAPKDRARARQLAELSEAAAAFFEQKLGVSFTFRLAVLGSKDWFQTHGAGMPYGIPWCSVVERLMVVPASLTEGVLIDGRNAQEDRWRVDFVTLHELGHLAAKHYLHPTSTHEEMPVMWFEELVATYFGYAFVSSVNLQWAQSARRDWIGRVGSYRPRKRSLDWSFMRSLPPAELAPTYAWYQYMLNLRVADIHDTHGLNFLRALKEGLSFRSMDTWTTKSLLNHLDRIAPGFQRWADELEKGDKQPRND